VYPKAKIMMLEGNPEHEEKLKEAAKKIGNADYYISVLVDKERDVMFYRGNSWTYPEKVGVFELGFSFFRFFFFSLIAHPAACLDWGFNA
jgi:hypothetical protein